MRLDGRRESSNVDDRRGKSGGKMALGGVGIGGIIIAIIMTLMQGGNVGDVVNVVAQQMSANITEQPASGTEFTAEEQELAKFSSQILAGTEDVWTEQFQKMGKTYQAPKMVLYTGSVQTGCGNGSSSMGPFYCSADQTVYIDLSFFTSMKRQLGADGDFAYAYVIAHEVGHHVQYLLGDLDRAHNQMAQLSEKEANKISIRLELQADYYAGFWGYHDNQKFQSLEDGDIDEALRCASVIGDDYLQKKARGYTQPETFNHGTSQQRHKWLKTGLSTGNFATAAQAFQLSDSQL